MAEQQSAEPESGPAARGVVFQIPRNALALLMMAQLAVLIPHVAQLSLWIVGVALFCGYWRTQIFRGHWGYPGATIKGALVLCSCVGVVVSGGGGFNLEGATALLLLAFALKLLEMKTRRDAILVIFLSYFVIATQFLFDQSLLLGIYELFATILVTAALIGMNQMHAQVRPLQSLRIATLLIAQALPLTFVLFLFFPRVSPFWTMPLPSGAKTGISDRMKPGDVAELSRSDELAFRVAFSSPVPPNRELYFRGLVYTDFADGTWSVPARATAEPLAAAARTGTVARYDVVLEPTGRRWLFALDVADPVASGQLARTAYHSLQANQEVLSVFRYRTSAWLDAAMDTRNLNRLLRAEALRIDPSRNQRLQAQASSWFAEVGGDPARLVERLAEHIRGESFYYTLAPQPLPDQDSVDAFWFDTREGFCTHYAGASVIALRSVGVPARMVGGYQGGSLNSITGHLEVRQYDAHAWVEYWVPTAGWVRFDPTAAVAPARIERGLSAALSSADRSQLSLFAAARLGNGGAIATMLEWYDSIEHRWNLWVVGFDTQQQQGILERLLGELSVQRIGLAMLGGGAASLALASLILFWRGRTPTRPPLERAFVRLRDRASRLGHRPQPGETPGQFVDRLRAVCQLAAADTAADRRAQGATADPARPSPGQQLEQALYAAEAATLPAEDRRRLLSQLRNLRLRLSLRHA